ncbi:MAG TPA: hypothetical protein VK826_20085, partial [Bacteroidia bacterium]|nr:hypothetical protein [Bacteroidia bacterium]
QRQCILDSMYSPRRLEKQSGESTYPCDYCRSKGDFFFTFPFYWIKAYEDDGAIYRLSTLDDSLISFYSVNRYRYMRLIEPTRFNCSNVMLFPDGPHELMIDSLFVPASDWRNFIVNTVITYVNSHTGVEGDCHNPAAFPIMLKQSFLISAEGLKLYPPGFTEDSDQLVITVPWNELDSYLRKDIRTKLPLTP